MKTLAGKRLSEGLSPVRLCKIVTNQIAFIYTLGVTVTLSQTAAKLFNVIKSITNLVFKNFEEKRLYENMIHS